VSLRRVLVGLLVLSSSSIPGCVRPFQCRDLDGGCMRPDAGRDAPLDTARPDTPRRDAGRDAGPPGEAGWTPFGDLPADCPIEYALHPENVLEADDFGWASCGTGCQRWTGDRRWTGGTYGWSPETVDAGDGVWLVLAERDRRFRIRVLWSPTAGLVMAFRDYLPSGADDDRPRCRINAAVRGAAFSASVELYEYDPTGFVLIRNWIRFYRGEVTNPGDVAMVVHRDDFPLPIQTLRLNETTIAAEIEGTVAVTVARDGTLTIPSTPLYPNYVQELQLTDAGTFWTDWGGYVALAYAPPGEEGRVIRALDRGDIREFSTDGEDYAWTEAYDQDPATHRYARAELWTGRWNGTSIDAHYVRDLDSHAKSFVGGGYYIRAELAPVGDRNQYVFYRLSDGARAIVVAPDGGRALDVLYATPTDVFLDAGIVFRIDPRTLVFE